MGILVEIVSDLIGIPGAVKRRSFLALKQPVTETINRWNVVDTHFPDSNRLSATLPWHRRQRSWLDSYRSLVRIRILPSSSKRRALINFVAAAWMVERLVLKTGNGSS